MFSFGHFTSDLSGSDGSLLSACKLTNTTEAAYDYSSQLLTLGLNQKLAEGFIMNISICNSTFVETLLSNQTFPAIDARPTTQAVTEVAIISFPPVCNGSSVGNIFFMAIDFSVSGKKCIRFDE